MAFQPVPTYQDPVEVDKRTGKFGFSPVWLSWFLELSTGGLSSTIQHNSLLGLQGGQSGQYYHLTSAQLSAIPFRSTSGAGGLPTGIPPTGSPMLFRNVDAFDEDVIVKGVGVTKLEFSRDNISFFDIGVVQGMIHLSPNDYLRITYSAGPTLTKVPR